MPTRRDIRRKAAEEAITSWMAGNTERWLRIPDVARGVGLSNPMAHRALESMVFKGLVHRSEKKWPRNGKVYPIYRMSILVAPDGPEWLCPSPPRLTPDQIKGIRTVLGFTGDMGAKRIITRAIKKP